MLIKKPKKLFFLIPLLIFSLFLTMVRPILAVGDYDTEIENIQKQIEEKEKRIEEISSENAYEANAEGKNALRGVAKSICCAKR